MNLSDFVPYLIVFLTLASVAGSITYIALTAGNPDTRNEIQKHVAVLTTVNLLVSIFLGFLLYMYILRSPSSFFPFTIAMQSFNMFLGIMAVSIAVMQQMS